MAAKKKAAKKQVSKKEDSKKTESKKSANKKGGQFLGSGSSIAAMVDAINKRYGEGTICKVSEGRKSIKLPRFSSGIPGLDMIVLGGGYPRGRQVEIIGQESVGKSTLATMAAVENQKDGYPTFWDDNEGVFDPQWFASVGIKNVVDMTTSEILNEDSNAPDFYYTDGATLENGNQHLDVMKNMVSTGELGLAVCDSIQGIIPQEEMEESMEDHQMGIHARLMNKGIRVMQGALNRKIDGKPNPCTVMWLNQTRYQIGGYGDPITSTGGEGRKFFASIRLRITVGGKDSWIYENESDPKEGVPAIGRTSRVQSLKNKTFPPNRKWEYDFHFANSEDKTVSKGTISIEKDLLRLGLRNKLIVRTGSWFTIGNKKNAKKFQGESRVLQFFKDDPSVTMKLLDKCRELEG